MTLNDPISNVLSHMLSYEKKGKNVIILKNNSAIIKTVLKLLQDNGYIGKVEEITDSKGNMLSVELIGNINNCGVIKPRYNVKITEYKKFEKRYLPAFGFGILIVSTSKGIMSQEEAVKQSLGGKLIAYVY